MKVAVAQMQVIAGNVEANLKRGMELIEEAKKEKCDLILLPEVWTTGFSFKKLKDLSKTTPQVIEEIKKLSRNICICGSYVVDNRETDKVFNIFYAIKNEKVIFEYKKTMLFGLTGEDKYFDRGDFNQQNTFKLNNLILGASVCYELRFPEFFRKSALNGALIHLNPAIWPIERLDHWKTLSQTRAIENQFFFLTANGTKTSGKLNLGGNSSIIDPWGKVLTNANLEEGVFTSTINLEELTKIRENFPFFNDSKIFRKLYTRRQNTK